MTKTPDKPMDLDVTARAHREATKAEYARKLKASIENALVESRGNITVAVPGADQPAPR